jgi:pyruvate formate lyase activating enzyme
MKDELFYKNSSGGVTLSGGELLVQHGFAAAILKALKERRINTAIETTGYKVWKDFERVLDYTDIVLYDLKHIDSNVHRYGTGVENSLILENLKKLEKLNKSLIIRIPLIPGFNMDEDSINKFIEFLKEINYPEVNLLPFHQLGSQKYTNTRKDYQLKDLKVPSDKEVESIRKIFEDNNFKVCIGG